MTNGSGRYDHEHYTRRVTLICVSIMLHVAGEGEAPDAPIAVALRQADDAKAGGANLVEYRVDEFFTGEGMHDRDAGRASEDRPRDTIEVSSLLDLIERSPLPAIVTCRSASEGGAYEGDESARVSLYERLATAFGRRKDGSSEHPPQYLDFELAAFERSANIRQKILLAVDHPEQLRDVRTGLVLSVHDFVGRPSDLTRRVARLREVSAARVHKIAFRARSLRDNLELFDWLRDRDRPTIALGMGEFGLLSRVLAPKFGGFLTFASLRASEATAPGQPTLRELIELYRFRSIGPRTRVYGVIGWPVGHSRSPLVHNAGFASVKFDGVYVPLPIAEGFESLKATLLELIGHEGLDFCGASVTLPHKESLVRLAREQGWALDEWSELLGAANTIVVERDAGGGVAGVRVCNTDAVAASVWMRASEGVLEGRSVVVVGAGGVARAVVGAAQRGGASVYVVNRTRAHAERLAGSFSSGPRERIQGRGRVRAASWDEVPVDEVVAVVNATPVGMEGGPAPRDSAIPGAFLAKLPRQAEVYDTVYAPIDTATLDAANAAGLRTHDGVLMFVLQAAQQFKEWTGQAAPVDTFESMVRKSLVASQHAKAVGGVGGTRGERS